MQGQSIKLTTIICAEVIKFIGRMKGYKLDVKEKIEEMKRILTGHEFIA